MSKNCKWLVEIEVSDEWINDGWRLDDQLLTDAIDEKLFGGHTQEGEIKVTIKKSPSDNQIKKAEDRVANEITNKIRNDK